MSAVTVSLGGRDYPVLPANLKAVRAWTECQQSTQPSAPERIDGMVAFIAATLRRATPDLADDVVWEHADNGNLAEIMRAISDAAGLARGEVKAENR